MKIISGLCSSSAASTSARVKFSPAGLEKVRASAPGY